jgi:hypothetical protein
VRIAWRVITVVSLSFLMLVGTGGVSLAYKHGPIPDCPGSQENLEEIVRANKFVGGGFVETATGVQGETVIRDRDWNQTCYEGTGQGGEYYGSGVTLRFVDSNGNVTGRFVNVGYTLWFSPVNGSNWLGPVWEGWNGSAWFDGACVTNDCLLSLSGIGKNCTYRIDLGTGTNWTVRSRCGNDPFQALHTFSSTGYSRGIAQSVTFRRGGIRTGMTDTWSELISRNPSGNWVNWYTNGLYTDTASNWHSANVTDTSYRVDRD